MSELQWYESRDNLRELASHLMDKDGDLDIVEFLEKPWKWAKEWEQSNQPKAPFSMTAKFRTECIICSKICNPGNMVFKIVDDDGSINWCIDPFCKE